MYVPRFVARTVLGLPLVVAALVGGLAGPSGVVHADEAGAASARRWTLGFSHGPLRRVEVEGGGGDRVTYLYMTMKVTNQTGLARPWRGLATATLDSRAQPYIAGGFPDAMDAIRRKEGDRSLMPFEATTFLPGDEGRLPNGESRTLVAVFGPVDPHWATFRIDVYGLVNPIATLKVLQYGDKVVVQDAAYQARNEKVMAELNAAAKASGSDVPRPTAVYQEVLERRSFRIEYRRQGDEFRPDDDPLRFVREGWQVIGDPKVLRTIGA